MTQSTVDPNSRKIHRVAQVALIMGVVVMCLKLAVFFITKSVAVLSDALESVINIIAAAVMLYSVWLSSRPADEDHPYGHGKIEFITLGFEGLMILLAGATIAYEAIQRLIHPAPIEAGLGFWLLLGVNVVNASLATYIYTRGKRYRSAVLIADAKHIYTDVASTVGVSIGLALVWVFKVDRLDPLMALILGGLILFTAWSLLKQGAGGLMDRNDAADQNAIVGILDSEVAEGAIASYHKIKHRHAGPFMWIDFHIQVDRNLNIADAHALGSRIERRIEDHFGQAKATAHIEPAAPVQGRS
jgi:cation diffusion facilitator family transporter